MEHSRPFPKTTGTQDLEFSGGIVARAASSLYHFNTIVLKRAETDRCIYFPRGMQCSLEVWKGVLHLRV